MLFFWCWFRKFTSPPKPDVEVPGPESRKATARFQGNYPLSSASCDLVVTPGCHTSYAAGAVQNAAQPQITTIRPCSHSSPPCKLHAKLRATSPFTLCNSPARGALTLIDPRGDGRHDKYRSRRWDELADPRRHVVEGGHKGHRAPDLAGRARPEVAGFVGEDAGVPGDNVLCQGAAQGECMGGAVPERRPAEFEMRSRTCLIPVKSSLNTHAASSARPCWSRSPPNACRTGIIQPQGSS